MKDMVILDAQDDGVGFQLDQQAVDILSLAGGYGLKAMGERLSQLGGSLQIESFPGAGTTVVAQLPL